MSPDIINGSWFSPKKISDAERQTSACKVTAILFGILCSIILMLVGAAFSMSASAAEKHTIYTYTLEDGVEYHQVPLITLSGKIEYLDIEYDPHTNFLICHEKHIDRKTNVLQCVTDVEGHLGSVTVPDMSEDPGS